MLVVIQVKSDVFVSQNKPLIFKPGKQNKTISHLTTELFSGQKSHFVIMQPFFFRSYILYKNNLFWQKDVHKTSVFYGLPGICWIHKVSAMHLRGYLCLCSRTIYLQDETQRDINR